MRWARRAGRVVVAGLFAMTVVRLVQAMTAHSLWLDEWCTIAFAFKPSRNFFTWFWDLAGAEDASFPTLYALTRLIGPVVAWGEQPVEMVARLPATVLLAGSLGLALYWSVAEERSLTGPWVAATIIGVLLAGDDWIYHASEGRVYGLMGALGVAAVVAAAVRRPVAASLCGLGLVLLHPFGVLIGFAPSCVVLAAIAAGRSDRLGVTPRQGRTVLAAAALSALAAGWFVVGKYVTHDTGFGFKRAPGDMQTIIAGLSLPAVAASVAAIVATLVAAAWLARRGAESPRVKPALAVYAAMLLTLGLGVAALLLLRPGAHVSMPRYITWLNPILLTIAVACAGMILDLLLGQRAAATVARSRARAGLVIAGVLATGAWSFHLLRTVSLGSSWANGLRETAAYLNAVAGPGTAVAHDSFGFRFPRSLVEGYPCPQAGQIVPYLSQEVRARMPCPDEAGAVGFGPEVSRAFVVREPIAWVGPRTLVLQGFALSRSTRIVNVTVEQYDRAVR